MFVLTDDDIAGDWYEVACARNEPSARMALLIPLGAQPSAMLAPA